MCGLCAARCPQGLVPYNVATLCRRLYGRYVAPLSEHVEERITEIEDGKFNKEIKQLKETDEQELRRMYDERDIEPALEQSWE